MGYPVQIALRYLGSKKRAFVSVGTAFAMLGVALGVAALAIVMSVTGGFQEQFREKVLGVNAHVIVLKYAVHFRDYRDVMKKVEAVPGVVAVAPFVINPMMVTHGERTATGVLLKGVDPEMMPKVLDLPRHIVEGSLDGMRKPGAKPPEAPRDPFSPSGGSWEPGKTGQTDGDGGTSSGTLSVLEAIERQIAEDKAQDAAADAGTPDLATLIATGAAGELGAPQKKAEPSPIDPIDAILSAPESAPAAKDEPPPALHPSGDVTPSGGYASSLPDEDFLPEAIDPDPCRSPAQVKALPGVAIGRSLSKRLDVGLGDCLQITSPQIGMTYGASGSRPPIAKQFRVIAIFEAGFDQYDSKLVYTDLYEAQAFYEQGDSVTGVEAKVDDIEKAADISKQVDKILANGVYHTMDWRELNHGLFTALLIQQIVMSVVLTLIIVVAAFTVIATLIMVVLDKKKEIALLKAIGASDDAILRVFVYQGGIIGLVGTALGLALGWVACKFLLAYGFPLDPKVYFISKLPVNVRPTEFIITGIVAILICLLATIFPAFYAARLRPSDGLRAE
ncbi:MAG: ABC transporter permease [Labilithrix sp.]|nr:ABC transporter permease [Labilithrix sp.]